MVSYPKYTTDIPYTSASPLNTLETYIPRPPSPTDTSRLWLIYVHGGAWRDPTITSTSFQKTRDILLASPIADRIAGYASVNYRLSPYPSHPTDPSNPADPARNATHPNHINDVLAAILYLQNQYQFDDRYILIGHSCGATLALQVAMKRFWGAQYESTPALELNVVPPVAIVGLEGIYDIPELVKSHQDVPDYRSFVETAFGSSDAEVWKAVSPTSGDFQDGWPDGRLVVLGHSEGDSLVEMEQPELMRKALMGQGWKDGEKGGRRVRMFELSGDHDEVWKTGEISKAIEWTVGEVLKEM